MSVYPECLPPEKVEAEARAKVEEKATETRSKEEDSHGWISILEKVRRVRSLSHEITQEVTRHR